MALVRISKQLLKDIEDKIKEIQRKDKELTLDPLLPISSKAVEDVLFEAGMRQLWGPYLHYKDTMPKEWLTSTERMDVSVLDYKGLRVGDEILINRKVVLPPNSGQRGYGYIEVKIASQDAPPEIKAPLDRYAAAKDAFDEKYKTLHRQVIGFLKSCKSLNDALKKFPDLAFYVPQDYLTRVEDVVERVAREKQERPPEMEIDRNMITSIGVLGKLQS